MKLLTKSILLTRAKKYKPFGKKIIRTTNLKYDITRFAFGGMCCICAILCLRCFMLERRSNNLETTLASISGEDISSLSSNELIEKTTEITTNYELAISNYDNVVATNKDLNTKLENMIVNILELDTENVSLVESNNSYYEQLTTFKERAELYDKYEYALVYEGERTDITYDQLKTGIDICEESGIDPNLLFAFIMAESHGQEKAKNPESSATGYGQVLKTTGEYVYENLLGNPQGSFTSTLLLDGTTNIQVTATYIAYLRDNTSSMRELIASYRGYDDPDYYNTIEKWLAKADTSMAEVERNNNAGKNH